MTPYPGTRWRHVRTGKVVDILGSSRLQVSGSPLDGQPATRYLCDGEEWTRPTAEFLDGRFVPVHALVKEDGAYRWTMTQDAALGTAPDAVLARRWGCPVQLVHQRRGRKGIPAFRPAIKESIHKWDRIHAMAARLTPEEHHLLETGTSGQCAAKLRVGREYVRLLRELLGYTKRLRSRPAEPFPPIPLASSEPPG